MSNMFEETPQQTVAEEQQQVSEPTTSEAQASPQAEVKQPETSPDANSLFADQLSSIKAEDGRQKYADVSTALQSIPHAQNHIKELSEKVKLLEAELQKRKGIEEMLERIESPKNDVATPAANTLDENSIDMLIEQRLTQRERQAIAKQNQQAVVSALKERYGDKAEEQFNAKANELGMSSSDLTELALKSPKAVLAYFGESKGSPSPSMSSSVNTAAMPKPSEPAPNLDWLHGGDNALVNKWRAAKPKD